MSDSTGDAGPQHDSAPARFSARWARSGWVAVIVAGLAVIAVAVAVWALLRPPPANTPAPVTDQQIADAKARACSAFSTVRTAVALQTHADAGIEPAAVQAVAANARLAMAGGGSYLVVHLDPATPAPLASAIRSFADDLQDIAMNALAGVSNDDPAQATRLRDGQAASVRIADLCK